MKTTRYFDEQVRRKRAYLDPLWIAAVVAAPLRRVRQADGRWRIWGAIQDSRDGKTRVLRVVMLDDGETVHNAFFDRNFQANSP